MNISFDNFKIKRRSNLRFIASGRPVGYRYVHTAGERRPMFNSNPFAELSASVPPSIMQAYVVVMAILVAAGTIFDVIHKRSARYFFDNWRNAKSKAKHQIGGGDMVSIAAQTAVIDVMTSGEFCNTQRRFAHLLTMYGFVIYVVTTAIMVFAYSTPTTSTPSILPILWYFGALMVCLGGYWFWFFIRVDVAAEGNSPFRFMRADLFVVSLILSVTLGLMWAIVQPTASTVWTTVFLALYLIATTVLFGSIPWSKFSHMFFKPAAALQKRVAEADGTRSNLPAPADTPAKFGSVLKHSHHY
jgi:hypothetical protein